MTHYNLKQLADTIEASKEPIETEPQAECLIIKTEKNSVWIASGVVGIAISILLIIAQKRAEHNLEIGLFLLWISVDVFWKMQNINKTIIIDLHQRTISVIPNFSFHRWILSNILKVETTFSLNELPDIHITYYSRSKSHRTRRIFFKKGIWTVYLLEFNKKEIAQKVVNLLKA